jgi:hypothetical protein
MTRIVVDASLREKLPNLDEVIELCDEEGRVLGRYLPSPRRAGPGREPAISEEELRRRENSEEWYTTDAVLKHLERL